MAKIVKKSSVLLSAVGAARIGIQTIGAETWTLVQEALEGLNTKVEARVRAFSLNGGSTLTPRPTVNVVSPTASVADNAGLTSTDLVIPDEVFMGVSAPGTPHSYKLWLDTSSSPTVPKRWNSGTSTWLKLKGGLNNRGQWTASTVYQVDDLVTNLGSAYLAKTDHTSTATPPASDTTNYSLLVAKGADGPGPGGAHAATHKGDGSDPIASATTSVDGLLSASDKTKLNSVATGAVADHGAASGLSDDDHAQYALADGTRLTLATSVSSPATRQLRLNGSVIERFNGSAWVALEANLAGSAPDVPKSQLEPLAIDTPDLAANRSIVIHVTSSTRPTTGVLEGQVIYETDTNFLLKNISTDPDAPNWTTLIPEQESFSPAWVNQNGADSLFVAYGDGNPDYALSQQNQALAAGPTAAQITPSSARLQQFRLPKNLDLSSAIVVAGVGSVPAIFRFGIYRASDLAKMWDSGLVSLNFITTLTITGVTLAADTDYWYAFTTNSSTNTTVYFRSMPTPYYTQLFQAAGAPFGNRSIGIPAVCGVAITGGALPDPLPTPGFANWAATTGTLPFLFLNGTAT